MKYEKITYKYDRKNDRIRLFFTGTREDSMGKWNSSGNYGDIYECTSHFVFIKVFGANPNLVTDTLEEMFSIIKQSTGCDPELEY
ncbi:hypothetical protein [Dysgonomonas gadei]|uniref:hypothetical protein n=1 Tax=Dysgonomonas gadei TaxID=156974 RepID=UPI003AF0EDDB